MCYLISSFNVFYMFVLYIKKKNSTENNCMSIFYRNRILTKQKISAKKTKRTSYFCLMHVTVSH